MDNDIYLTHKKSNPEKTKVKLCSSFLDYTDIFIFNRTDDLSSFYYYTDIALNIRLSAEPFGLSVIESMKNFLPGARRMILVHI